MIAARRIDVPGRMGQLLTSTERRRPRASSRPQGLALCSPSGRRPMQRIVMIVAICGAFAFLVTATIGLWRPSVYSLASAP
jgi:hypothetical protein